MRKKLSNAKGLNTAVGMGLAKTLREHFRSLDLRPNKRGWRKSHFWRGMASATAFAGAAQNGAVVAVQKGRVFGAKLRGATVRPTGGRKFLAIPAIEERYGKMPSALDDASKLRFRPTRRGGLLGVIRADGTMQVHYWLVRKATIPRDPETLPPHDSVVADIRENISKYLK